jgi:hypothetical protein
MPTIDEQISIISDYADQLVSDIQAETSRANAANSSILSTLTSLQVDVESALFAMQEEYLTEADLLSLDDDLDGIEADFEPMYDTIEFEQTTQDAADGEIDGSILTIRGHVSTLQSMAFPYVTMEQKTDIDDCVTTLNNAISLNSARKTSVQNSIASQNLILSSIQTSLTTMTGLQPLETAE